MKTFDDWLAFEGGNRTQAVKSCADRLLAPYQEQWPQLVPTELHRLAFCQNAAIDTVKSLQSGANLLPVPGGFRVLISEDLPASRFRTAVAHELAHTLFYDCSFKTPQRLITASQAEEHFCFDVARQLLAPLWMLEAMGITQLTDAGEIFRALVGQLKLSRPIAARVMLSDHKLVHGVAARWIRCEGEWQLQKHAIHATTTLSLRERKQLHGFARRWLTEGTQPISDAQISGEVSQSQDSAFIVVGHCLRAFSVAT